jgi:hypothetical protein
LIYSNKNDGLGSKIISRFLLNCKELKTDQSFRDAATQFDIPFSWLSYRIPNILYVKN